MSAKLGDQRSDGSASAAHADTKPRTEMRRIVSIIGGADLNPRWPDEFPGKAACESVLRIPAATVEFASTGTHGKTRFERDPKESGDYANSKDDQGKTRWRPLGKLL